MARRELMLRVPIPPNNVHRMQAEDPHIGRAAHHYEAILRKYLEVDERGFPIFHLVLLGIGLEGHTASLFPGSRLLQETSRWVSTPMVAKLGMRRMTLTLPMLEAARRVLFLAAGKEKAAILHQVLCEHPVPPLPAQLVQPRHGERTFLIDEEAAALLGAGRGPKEVRKPVRPGRNRGAIHAGAPAVSASPSRKGEKPELPEPPAGNKRGT